ncbi:MAG: DUF302 domain-containing protein [Desulfobulbaceae bacterium]|jgi:uncharacterized protein (DUF302 family)|nr:DUF302 domain-containing protein [Desulfobulbaceae bacterium]MDY0350952.1 DUF302 domain-containing protein [Desulfobulbaceae bacterium]
MGDNVYRNQTEKKPVQFVDDLQKVVQRHGFIIHNESTMEMARTFGRHGAEVAEGFDLHMIQLCKPDKAAASLQANPERAILMPKHVMVFSRDEHTQIRFFHFNPDNVRVMVDDRDFPASLAGTYGKIIDMIEEAIAM